MFRCNVASENFIELFYIRTIIAVRDICGFSEARIHLTFSGLNIITFFFKKKNWQNKHTIPFSLTKSGSTTLLTGDDDESDDHDLDPQGVSVRADPEQEQTQCQCSGHDSQHSDRLARRVPIYKQKHTVFRHFSPETIFQSTIGTSCII